MDIAYPVSDNGDSLEEGAWRSCRALFFARGEPSRGFESCRPWNLFLQSLVFLLASIGFYRLLQTSTDFHPQPHIFLSLAISRLLSPARRLPDACQIRPAPVRTRSGAFRLQTSMQTSNSIQTSVLSRTFSGLWLFLASSRSRLLSRTFSSLWLCRPHSRGYPH